MGFRLSVSVFFSFRSVKVITESFSFFYTDRERGGRAYGRIEDTGAAAVPVCADYPAAAALDLPDDRLHGRGAGG